MFVCQGIFYRNKMVKLLVQNVVSGNFEYRPMAIRLNNGISSRRIEFTSGSKSTATFLWLDLDQDLGRAQDPRS